jgi:hypothetical protein
MDSYPFLKLLWHGLGVLLHFTVRSWQGNVACGDCNMGMMLRTERKSVNSIVGLLFDNRT